MFLSEGFCNLWLLWHPASAGHGSQQHVAPPQGLVHLWTALQSSSTGVTPTSEWHPSLSRQLPPALDREIPRVLLAQNPQQTALPPSEPQLHPFYQGLLLSLVAGKLFQGGGCSWYLLFLSSLWSSHPLLVSPPL